MLLISVLGVALNYLLVSLEFQITTNHHIRYKSFIEKIHAVILLEGEFIICIFYRAEWGTYVFLNKAP